MTNPFDNNDRIRDAVEKGLREGFKAPPPGKLFNPEPKPPNAFGMEQPESWSEIFKKAFKEGLEKEQAKQTKPFVKPEFDWTVADLLGAPSSGSPLPPAELPGETRQAVAQMYSQFQEFQRAGFSRDEAWELTKIGWATSVAIVSRHRLRQGEDPS